MAKIILWAIILYFLYKFLFDVVVPVGKASSDIRSKIKEMQNVQQKNYEQQQTFHKQEEQKKENTSVDKNDYIDFEEVK